MNLQEIKASRLDKFSQGDVNIYRLAEKPSLKTKPHSDPVLVVGQSGNHHRLAGSGWTAGVTATGQFVVTVTGKKVSFEHEQHKPAIALKPGEYLFDRAVEKGMFTDMKAPVQD